MSKRISKERANELYQKDLELRQHPELQQSSSRRQKKYLLQVRKQKGFFKYLSERHKLHGHKKTSQYFEDMSEEESR